MELKYQVVNATKAQVSVELEIDGEIATVIRNRTVIEAIPVGHDGGTLRIEAPADFEDFAEGAVIVATLSVEA